MTNDKGEIRYGIRFSVLSCLLDSLLHAVSQNIPFELGFHPDCCKNVCPDKAGMFSGRSTHGGTVPTPQSFRPGPIEAAKQRISSSRSPPDMG